MKIRPATTTADYRYIAGLYHPRNTRYFVAKTMSVKRLREKPCDDFICTVAGRLVGWFRLLPHDRQPRHAWLVLIIDRPYWGKGYGTRAMAAMEKIARRLGYRRLLLRVMPENKPAVRLYQKCGFKRQYTVLHLAKSLSSKARNVK